MSTITVQAGGNVETISFTTSDAVYVAGTIATAIDASDSSTSAAIVVGGTNNVAANISGIVVAATAPVTMTGAASVENVIAGSGGLVYVSAADSTDNVAVAGGNNSLVMGAGSTFSVVAGPGNDAIFAYGSGTIDADATSSTIVAGSGNLSITTHTDFGAGNAQLIGASLMYLGAGAASILSGQSDTIQGGTGPATIQASGAGTLLFARSGATDFIAEQGVSTVDAFSGGVDTLQGQGGTMVAFTYTPTLYEGGTGADTLVAESGAFTLQGGAGAALAFGFSPMLVQGGSGADTVVGETAPLTVQGGSGASLYFGASVGGNMISGGTGAATIIGGGDGDVLSTGGSGANVVAAAGGAETVDASQSSGTNAVFLGSGADVFVGGAAVNAILIGTGPETLSGGSDGNLYVFASTSGATRDIEITNFNPSQDFLELSGYATGTAAAVVAAASVTAAGEVLTLPDGTTINMLGVSNLTASSFT